MYPLLYCSDLLLSLNNKTTSKGFKITENDLKLNCLRQQQKKSMQTFLSDLESLIQETFFNGCNKQEFINLIIGNQFINILSIINTLTNNNYQMQNYLSQSGISKNSHNQEIVHRNGYILAKNQNKQNQKPEHFSLLRDFAQKHCTKVINKNSLNPFEIKPVKSEFLKQSQAQSSLNSQFSTVLKSNYQSRCLSRDTQSKQINQKGSRNFSYSKSFGNLKMSLADQKSLQHSPAKTEKLTLNESRIQVSIIETKLKNTQLRKKELQQKLERQKNKLQEQKRMASTKIQILQTQNTQLKKKLVQIQAQMELLSGQSKQLLKKYDNACNSISQAERTIKKQKHQIDTLKINFQSTVSKIQDQKMNQAIQSIKDISFRFEKCQKQNQKLRSQIQNQNKQYQASAKKLKDQLSSAQLRNEQFSSRQQLWTRQFYKIKDERQADSNRIKLLQHQLESAIRQNTQLHQYLVNLKQAKAQLNGQAEKAIENLTSQMEKRINDNTKLKKQVQKRQNLIKQMKLQHEANIRLVKIHYENQTNNTSKANKATQGLMMSKSIDKSNNQSKQSENLALRRQLAEVKQKQKQQRKIHQQYLKNMNDRLNNLQQQLQSKNLIIQGSKRQISKLERTIKQIKEQNKRLQQNFLKIRLQGIDKINQQCSLSILQSKYRKLDLQNAAFESQNECLKIKIESLKNRVEQLNSQALRLNNKNKAQNQSQIEKCHEQQKELIKLRSNIHVIEQQKYSLKKQLNRVNQQLSQVSQNYQRKLAYLHQNSLQSQTLYLQFLKAQQQLVGKQSQIRELSNKIASLSEQNKQNQISKNYIENQYGIVLCQIKKQEDKCKGLQQTVYQRDNKIKTLQQKIDALKGQLSRVAILSQSVQSSKIKIQLDYKQQLRHLKSMQGQKDQLILALQEKIKMAQDRCTKKQERNGQLTRENLVLNQNLSQLKQKYKNVAENADTIRAKFDRSQAQLQLAITKTKTSQKQYRQLQNIHIEFRQRYEVQMSQRQGIIDREIELLKRQFLEDKDGISMTAKQQIQTILKQLQILEALNLQKKKQIDTIRQQNQQIKMLAQQTQAQLRKNLREQGYKYETTIKQLGLQLNGLHQRNRNLIVLHDEKQANIQAIRAHQQRVEGQFTKQLRQMELQLQAHADKNQRTSKILIELDIIRQQNESYKKHLYELENIESQMKENISILNNKLIRMDDQLCNCKADKQKYYSEAEGLTIIVQKLQNVIKIKQQQEQNINHKSRILNEQNEHLQESLRSLRNQNEELYHKAIQFERSYKEANAKIQQLQKINFRLKGQIDQLLYMADQQKSVRAKQEHSLNQYKGKIRQIQQMLNWKQEQAKQIREKCQKKLDQKETELIRFQKQKAKFSNRIEQVNKQLRQRDDLIAQLQRAISKQKVRITQSETQANRYKAKRDQLIKQRDQQQSKMIQLRTLLAEERQKLNYMKNKHDNQMQTFKSDYQTLYTKYQKYKDLARVNKEKIQAQRTVARSHMRFNQQILAECKNQICKY